MLIPLKEREPLDVLADLTKGAAIAVLRNEVLEEVKAHSLSLRRHLSLLDRIRPRLTGTDATQANIAFAAAVAELRRVEARVSQIVLVIGDRHA